MCSLTTFRLITTSPENSKQPLTSIQQPNLSVSVPTVYLYFSKTNYNGRLEYLLARNIIEPSDSPFGFPVLFSRRKNDPRSPTDPSSYRMCLDLRKLNALVTSNSTFAIPILSFWQIPVKATDRQYIAIVTKFGKFSFRSLPFGYKHASEIFQHWITLLFQDIPGVHCYIDDVLLLSFGTFQQHCDLIRRVRLRCREQRVYLKKSKAHFFQETVEFLGHKVSANGIATQYSKTAAILDWSPPTNVKQLKTFLGLSSYYRKFVRSYAHLAAPLHQLLRKDVPFIWSTECDQAFTELKRRLTTSPVLSHFDPLRRTEIQTDASNTALGGTLLQYDYQGREKVVGFYSRLFTAAERNYSTTERELLALKDTLLHFQFYLLGMAIIVRTDHKALTYFSTQQELKGRLRRRLETLSEFSITEIAYVKGTDNIVPDALSRQYPDSVIASPRSDAILHEDDQDFLHLLALDAAAAAANHANVTLVTDLHEQIVQAYSSCP
eukprot:768490-Hanusia_phi.AAC.2